jgi:hypothetical protein
VSDGLFHDRESIQPRAFAVRHLVIQEVKFRKQRQPDVLHLTLLERVARGVEVEYDAGPHGFIVRCEGRDVRRIPMHALSLYARGDSAAVTQRTTGDLQHWDAALEDNRREIALLVDEMLAMLARAPEGPIAT